MPTSLATALRNRYNTGIAQTRPPIHTENTTRVRKFPMIMKPQSGKEPLEEVIFHSDCVMTRVRMVNATLRHLRINCSELDTLAGAGAVQLAAVQEMARTGSRSGIRTALSSFRITVTSLRDAYREILIREDLPGETAQGVLSVAQSLDVTAVKAGIT